MKLLASLEAHALPGFSTGHIWLCLPICLSWSLQRQVVPLAFPGLGSLVTAAPGPWNYCLIHTQCLASCSVILLNIFLPQHCSLLVFASVVRGRVCSPPHSAGRFPGDNTRTAERAALPRNHPLLWQRQGKAHTVPCSLTCASDCIGSSILNTWCLQNRNVLHIVYKSILYMFLQLVLMRNLFIY